MTSKDEHSDSPQSYSRGWNQPRSDSTQEIPATPQGAASNPPQEPYDSQAPNAQPYNQWYSSPAAEQPAAEQPAAGTPGAAWAPGADAGTAKTSKSKRTVGLGTALAMMLVAGIGAGGLTGYIVGNNSSSNSGTSVSEILNSQPVNNVNSTGEEAESGTTEAVAARVLPAVVSIQVVSSTEA